MKPTYEVRFITVQHHPQASPLEPEGVMLLEDLGRLAPLLVPLGGELLLLGLLLGQLLLHLLQHTRVTRHDRLHNTKKTCSYSEHKHNL